MRKANKPPSRPGRKSIFRFLLPLIACASLALCLASAQGRALQQAQSPQPGQPAQGASGRSGQQPSSGRTGSGVLVSLEEDYRIGANDVIDIQIDNAAELSRSFRVTAAGTFLMPYLGRITAQNKTPEELAQYIAGRLRGDYLRDPKVTVSVKEYNSRSFFIQGSVRNPGVYQIEGRPSLLELITLASGLTESHGATAFIIRKIKQPQKADGQKKDDPPVAAAAPDKDSDTDPDESARYELKSVNINGLLKGRFEQDMFLEPGDIINIPVSDVFFVAGEVNQPGSFPLKEGTTLRQAISLAMGTNFKAATDRGVIFRENANGKREEMRVDIASVMSGKREDIPILANDIIIVPNSRMKSVGGALLRAFGLTSITRVPIP
ncbi:MAG TPA: polysaccharide biosynthesis/export family protein [Blastocatellia bacterium]|jgi:polysaccharide export outer membrane protein